jgi:hypothetical protein
MADDAAAIAAPTGERDATDRLSHVHGPSELHAVLLALLLPHGSRRAARAWQIEAGKAPGAEALRAHATSLSGAARLPWFELLLAARRVRGARGSARPIDRLHWLTLRRGLGEAAPLAARPEAHPDEVEWLESDVQSVAGYTAFLSRMVPGELADSPLGEKWYDAVMASFPGFAEIPRWQPPKAAAMVDALARLQTLSWMQRPVVVRTWVTTALAHSRFGRLTDLYADALRMTCALLDSPQPPELARHYIVLANDGSVRS